MVLSSEACTCLCLFPVPPSHLPTSPRCIPSPLPPTAASQLQDAYAAEREALLQAWREGVAYLVGRSALRAAPGAGWFKVGEKRLLRTLWVAPTHYFGRLEEPGQPTPGLPRHCWRLVW